MALTIIMRVMTMITMKMKMKMKIKMKVGDDDGYLVMNVIIVKEVMTCDVYFVICILKISFFSEIFLINLSHPELFSFFRIFFVIFSDFLNFRFHKYF